MNKVKIVCLPLMAAVAAMFLGSTAGVGASLRNLTAVDAQSWRRFVSTELTPQGDWFAFEATTADGAHTVGLRQLDSKQDLQYAVGKSADGAGNLALSRSGKYAAFVVAGLPGKEVWVIDLSSQQKTVFKDADRFSFAPRVADGDWIVISSLRKPGETSGHLELKYMTAGTSLPFDGVKEFSFSKSGSQLAISTTDGTSVLALSAGKAETTCRAPQSANGLTWSPHDHLLVGFVDGNDRGGRQLLVFSNTATTCQDEIMAPSDLRGFPVGQDLLDDTYFNRLEELDYSWNPLEWRDDETGFFVSTAPGADHDPVLTSRNLSVWHSADSMLPTERHDPMLGRWRPRSLGYIALRQHSFTQLGGSGILFSVPHPRAQKILAFDDAPYRREFDLTYRLYRDVYLVDVATGVRTLVVRRLQMPMSFAPNPHLSPDGRHLVYLDGPNVFAYDVATGSRRQINQSGDFFQDVRTYDRMMRNRRTRIFLELQGWSSDGCSVLMSDVKNIWALPLCGGVARNLTETGSKRALLFTLRDFDLSGQQDWLDGSQTEALEDVDLSRPVYFMFENLDDRSTGLAVRRPGAKQAEILTHDSGRLQFLKASSSPRMLVSRETAVTYPDFYVVGPDWKPAMRITDINPQQREFDWYPGDLLLNYKGTSGLPLQTVLYLPLHYRKGRSYPTIVEIYEEQGSAFNYYTSPRAAQPLAAHDVPFWTSQGYAVMCIDTTARPGGVGAQILSDVTVGVRAAVRTGIVDRKRLGLEGLSYGGYETEFIVTRSNLFKAAVAESSLPDLIEAGRGVLSGWGMPSEGVFEMTAGFTGPWWRNLDGYMANSAMYATQHLHTPLLLIQGEDDPRTPVATVIGFFNTIREHDNRDTVLLTYAKNAHALETDPADMADIMARKQQFYARFLKGEPAPAWWSNGRSLSKGEAAGESPVWLGDQARATQSSLTTK